MTLAHSVVLRVFPDDCDAYGHVNQAAYLRLFERARWESLASGPGLELFTPDRGWPVVRRSNVEYHAAAFPGNTLRFDMTLTHVGRSSFSVHQQARREHDHALVASADIFFVCIDRTGRPVTVPNGVRERLGTRPDAPGPPLSYRMEGGRHWVMEERGDGPAVVFIHGFPMDRTMWRILVPPLGGWHRIAPDLPGFGLSDPGTGQASVGNYADGLAGVLDAMRVERVVLCGLSLGGYVAFEFWRRHRARVRGLVLMCTRPEHDGPDARASRESAIASVHQHGLGALAKAMVPRLLSPSTVSGQPAVAAHLRTMMLDSQPEGVIAALRAMRDRADSTALLGEINVPTLVVAGADDAVIPKVTSRAMAAAIPGARFEMLPGVGHVPPLEAPVASGQLLRAFLGGIG